MTTKRMAGVGLIVIVLSACAGSGASNGGAARDATPGTNTRPATSAAAPTPTRSGWNFGTARGYTSRIDSTQRSNGRASGHLASVIEAPTSFGNLMQVIRADAYAGKRVRLEANIRTRLPRSAPGRRPASAALWMRADLPDGSLLLENMGRTPILGDNGWSRHGIELDIPANAVGISLGFILFGPGEAWIDDVTLTAIRPASPDAQPTTPRQRPAPEDIQRRYAQAPTQPVGLDFEAVP